MEIIFLILLKFLTFSQGLKLALDKSILKETCERLISKVLNEIENTEMQTDIDRETLNESVEIDMEKCLIEHFGNFLTDVIQTVENKSTNN